MDFWLGLVPCMNSLLQRRPRIQIEYGWLTSQQLCHDYTRKDILPDRGGHGPFLFTLFVLFFSNYCFKFMCSIDPLKLLSKNKLFYFLKLKCNYIILLPFLPYSPSHSPYFCSNSWPLSFNCYRHICARECEYTHTILNIQKIPDMFFYHYYVHYEYVYNFRTYHLVLNNKLGDSSLKKTSSPALRIP